MGPSRPVIGPLQDASRPPPGFTYFGAKNRVTAVEPRGVLGTGIGVGDEEVFSAQPLTLGRTTYQLVIVIDLLLDVVNPVVVVDAVRVVLLLPAESMCSTVN